jgi:hypothetical protein
MCGFLDNAISEPFRRDVSGRIAEKNQLYRERLWFPEIPL